MVYPGRPSTGCQTCRSRRIKCDEARPNCNACLRSGRECPGYPHPLDVVLRPQKAFNRKSSNKTPSPAVTTSSQSSSIQEDQEMAIFSPSTSSTSSSSNSSTLSPLPFYPSTGPITSPQIPGGLYLPMEETVTSLFFNSYIYTPRDPSIRSGSMECLPQLYAVAPYDSHLRLASLAVAFFGVAAWTRQEGLLLSAQKCFGRALARTREALMGDVEGCYDEIVMTLMLLYIYEEFVSIKENKPSPKHHLRGAIALIQSCSPERRSSPLSDTLTNAIQGEIIFSAMDDAAPLLQTPSSWPLSPGIPELASSRLMTISASLVKLRERWFGFSSCADLTHTAEIESILSEARSIDEQFVSWTHSLPKHWDPTPATYFPQSVKDAGSYRNLCDCYSDIWIAGTWNNYRTFRLSVQNIIFHCLHLLRGNTIQSESEIQMTLSTINTLATAICATVPFYLGSQTGTMPISDNRIEYPSADSKTTSRQAAQFINGWILRPSLEALCGGENLDGELVEWVRGQVRRIMGIYTEGLGGC